MMDLARLHDPFPRASVHWRAQSVNNDKTKALALAYIDARDVMDRLDDVCGPDRWQSEITETARGRVICRLGILTEFGWVWKSDGAGDTDVEGEKGGISDALKRAAVAWGVGRYLYRLSAPWVPCEVGQNGKWRKWTADPWDYVRNAPSRPSAPRENAASGPSPVEIAAETASKAKDYADLTAIWNAHKQFQQVDFFRNAVALRKAQLQQAA